MTAEDAGERDPPDEFAAEIDALEREVRMLHDIRHGLASQPGIDVMVEATSGVIEEREAELERARRRQS